MFWRKMHRWATAFILLAIVSVSSGSEITADDEYNVGVAIADVTGICVQTGTLGYFPPPIADGIHTRLFARAFIFSKDGKAVVYVSVDIALMDTAVKLEVCRQLKEKLGPIYTLENIILSATHTHTAPGGYSQYALYGIASLGFQKQTFDAIVTGIVESIVKAHNNPQRARVSIARGRLDDVNHSRSTSAYLKNPEEERMRYDTNVDKDMVQVRIHAIGTGQLLGAINLFAVHPVNMGKSNTLLSSDNQGYAAVLFEQSVNPAGTIPGEGAFVAAFGSTNLGDVSPERPAASEKESTKIMGQRLSGKAQQLLNEPNPVTVKGSISYVHQTVDMSKYQVTLENETKVTTCPAAFGQEPVEPYLGSPVNFPFTPEGGASGNPDWDYLRSFISIASPSLAECQRPKKVLLPVGEIPLPYEWVARIVETQIFRIGNLFMLAFPGEVSTMGGRRLIEMAKKIIMDRDGTTNVTVVITGLSNSHTQYCATFEEYQVQEYEGSNTLYGPYTHAAYMQQYASLTMALLDGTMPNKGPTLPWLIDFQISFLPPTLIDTSPLFQKFGDCIQEPANVNFPGATVVAKFVAGNPRNDPRRGATFCTVEYKANETVASWDVVATDANWETEFRWVQSIAIVGSSESECKWEVPLNAKLGFYQICHFGSYKQDPLSTLAYEGCTKTFKIEQS